MRLGFLASPFFLLHTAIAQKKEITLEDIWVKGTFEEEKLQSIQSMSLGDYYTVLNQNSYGSYLDKFDFETLDKDETLVHSKDLEGVTYFTEYAFDPAEKKLLLGTELQKIYRYSKRGKYFVYDLESKQLELVSEFDIQAAHFFT